MRLGVPISTMIRRAFLPHLAELVAKNRVDDVVHKKLSPSADSGFQTASKKPFIDPQNRPEAPKTPTRNNASPRGYRDKIS
jgi:hypothetical protein